MPKDDTSNNTPSETRPYESPTAGLGGEGLKSWANSLAESLDISVQQATAQLKAYIADNGGSPQEAAVYLANHGPTGGSGGSSGGSSGGGSSSGGSSGPAGPSPQSIANAKASYLNMLTGWGVEITPEVNSFVNKAVAGGMMTSKFLQTVRATKFYAKTFPGIMKKDGTMRMTEAQYVAGYQQARDTARSLGRGFSEKAYGLAIQNGNSPSEIRDKLAAVDTLKQYGPMFEDFNGYLMATGVIKKPLTRKEQQNFIMGQAPKQFYDAYRTAQAAAQVEELGFEVGKGGDIGYKELAKVSAQIEVLGQQGDYAGLLAAAQTVVNEGEFYGMGITRKDKVKLALGAPGSREAAAKLKNAVDIKVAAFEPRANADIVQSSSGTQMLGGAQSQQSSE